MSQRRAQIFLKRGEIHSFIILPSKENLESYKAESQNFLDPVLAKPESSYNAII